MDSLDNQSPTFQPAAAEQPPATPALTPAMMEYLKKTKPWVRLISILGFIGAGFMILAGLIMFLGAGIFPSISRSAFHGAPVGVFGFVYVVMGAIYFFPPFYLKRYADGIKRALAGDEVGGVEYALKSQKSFWTFSGIVALIFIIIMFAAFLFVILAAIIVGTRGRL